MPLKIKQYVLRLDIPIHDPPGVQVLNAQKYLHKVEAGHVLGHPPILLDIGEELATWAVLHHEGYEIPGLEGVSKGHEEGVTGLCHDVALVLDDYFTPVLSEDVFLYQFHGVELAVHTAAH
jgi:hypothetical protein